jgi:hypothetical protein
MALQRQQLELPIIKGVDTKTDSKQLKIGKLLSAQNVTFRKPGKIQKREGFQSVSNNIIGSANTITDGQAIMNFKEELLAFDKNNIYSYVQATDNWKDKGDFQSAYLTSQPISNGTSRDYSSDNAIHPSGLEAYVFARDVASTTTLYYQINDSITGQTIIGPEVITTQGRNPRVCVFEDQFVFFYYNSNNNRLYRGVLPIANIANTIAFDFITDNSTNANSVDQTYQSYDANVFVTATSGSQLYVAFSNGETSPSAGITIWQFYQPTDTIPGSTIVIADTQMKMGQLFYDPISDGPSLIYSEALGAGDAWKVYGYNWDLTNLEYLASEVITGAQVNRVTAVSTNPSTREIVAFIDYAIGDRPWVKSAFYDGFNITSGFSSQQIQVSNAAFTYAGKAYFVAVGGADIVNSQSSYFIIDENGKVVGRFNNGTAGGVNVYPVNSSWSLRWVSKTNSLSDTEFLTSFRNITEFGEIGGETQTGITSITIDYFEPERSYSRAEIAGNLFVGGAMLFSYDGQNLVEDGFNWNPVINSVTPSVGAGTNNYSYVAVWEWVDNAGNLHRSAPSEPYDITTSSPIGAGASVGTIQLFPLSLTEKTVANNRSPVVCVLYRTKVNGTEYYKLPVTTANNNNTTALFITPATDNTPDTDLVELIYTTDGVLPNDISPPVGSLVVHRNRLFLLDSTNPLVIYYSKQVNAFNPVEWSDAQVINVDPTGGPVIGLASLDDKLIIFKESSIRFITGQGPQVDGNNNDYGDTILITADAGCNNLRSIVNTPEGVIFKSSKGIYIINRGLQVSYIGAAVEAFNPDFVTSAVLMAENNQIRITLDTAKVLVYDYFVDAWSIFTNIDAVDSIIWKQTQAYIDSTGKVAIETPNTFEDDGTPYSMEITTGWLNMSGIQGFQRLWKFYILGEFKSEHELEVNLYYDYNNTIGQTINVEPVVPNFYGGTSPYGSGSYGGSFDLYQYEIRPARQKCMCIKVQISDQAVSGALGQGYELSNLRFEYGVEGGGNRVRDRQVAG